MKECKIFSWRHCLAYFEMCKNYSKKITANQNQQIPHTLYGAMSLIAGALEKQCISPLQGTVSDIESSLANYNAVSSFKPENVTKAWANLTFENYFMIHNSCQQPPLQFIWNAELIRRSFVDVLGNSDNRDHRIRLQAYTGKQPIDEHWKKILTNLESVFKDTKYIPPPARQTNAGNYDWLGLRLCWVLATLHCCIFDIDKFSNVPLLFKPPNPVTPQQRSRDHYRMFNKIFTNFDWLKHYVFGVHRQLVGHVDAKVDFEQFVVLTLQKCDGKKMDNKMIKKKLVSDPNFDYNFSLWKAIYDESQPRMEAWSANKKKKDKTQLGLNASSLRDRMKCLAYNVLLMDIIETFLENGPDPCIPPPPTDGEDNLAMIRKYNE